MVQRYLKASEQDRRMLEAIASTWYRYFFYGWLFRDADRGTPAERFASWRHNKEQARRRPTYLLRWAVAGVALFAAAEFFEVTLSSPTIAALLYVPAALSLPFDAVTILCWAWLRFR